MAYRRRQGISRASTFKEEIHHPHEPDAADNNQTDAKTFTSSRSFTASSSPATSLAAQAIRASAASASASRKTHSPVFPEDSDFDASRSKGFNAYEDARNDSKGFWGVLARKAKAILDDDNMMMSQQSETSASRVVGSSYLPTDASSTPRAHQNQQQQQQQPSDHGGIRRMDSPALRRGLDKLNASLNQIGDTFDKAFEEGRTIVESKTQDIIQETRKLQIRRKEGSPMEPNQVNSPSQLQNQTNITQLKASRDVAMATAAKAKVLLRELKTVKADLAFAKARCSQLEEENKLLRESRETGGNPADDDLIRLQLETLLAEKARLAHENSIYARENRFLREVVEYHQLTMQDVVYLDEGAEEMTEVYPINLPYSKLFSDDSPTSPKSPQSQSPSELTPPPSPSPPPLSSTTTTTKEILTLQQQQQEKPKAKDVDVTPTPTSATPTPLPNKEEEARRPPISSAQI